MNIDELITNVKKKTIKSEELKKLNKIESNKKIYKMLEVELKNHIHSLQILIN